MNGIHELWFGYFWPSLQGNGPEDLLSYLLIGGGVVWLGKKLVTEWRAHKAHIDEEHAKLHARLDHHTAKLDHLILNHPDIPNEVPGLSETHQPK